MTRVPAASDPLADQPFPLSELWEAVLLCSMPTRLPHPDLRRQRVSRSNERGPALR